MTVNPGMSPKRDRVTCLFGNESIVIPLERPERPAVANQNAWKGFFTVSVVADVVLHSGIIILQKP
jgi:hypothetical protein